MPIGRRDRRRARVDGLLTVEPTRPARPIDYAPWMRVAGKMVGLRELIGGELNPEVRRFFTHTKFPMHLVNSRTSWCAAWASTVLDLAQVESPHTASARAFLHYGVPLAQPVYGALLIFSRGTGSKDDETKGHVGFCPEILHDHHATQVLCLAGNQRNRICSIPQAKSRLLGVRWPPNLPLPPTAAALEVPP